MLDYIDNHRFVDGEKGYRRLQLLRNKYLEKLLTRTRTELEDLTGKGDDSDVFDRIAELDRRMIEPEHFKEKLVQIRVPSIFICYNPFNLVFDRR